MHCNLTLRQNSENVTTNNALKEIVSIHDYTSHSNAPIHEFQRYVHKENG